MLKLNIFGGFSLSDGDGTPIVLKSRKAMGLLAFLALPPDTPRSREVIMALLWSDRSEAQARGSLRQLLSALRKELDEDVLEIDNHAVTLKSSGIDIAKPDGNTLLAGFSLKDEAFEEWLRDERLRLTDASTPAAPQVEELDDPTVAVLPFTNMSNDPEQDFFSDGIAQDIITEISRFRDLYVIAPRSSFQFKGTTMSAEEIGKELEADYILEGSVRRAGNRVRITAQLIDVEEDTQVWGARYDRDLEDVFAIQEEVAREVATAVPGKIDLLTHAWMNEQKNPNPTAYEYLLKAENLLLQEYGAQDAMAYLQKAIEADDTAARAYANLASLYSYRVFEPFTPFEESRDQVRELAEKALRCDSNDPVVLILVCNAYLNIGDHAMSQRCLDSALRLNPHHYSVLLFGAHASAWLGHPQNAQDLLERYFRHIPKTNHSDGEIAFEVYFMAERFEDAISALSQWSELSLGNYADMAAALGQAGRVEEAHKMKARFEEEAPDGYGFADYYVTMDRVAQNEREKSLWHEGYQKAGFEI